MTYRMFKESSNAAAALARSLPTGFLRQICASHGQAPPLLPFPHARSLLPVKTGHPQVFFRAVPPKLARLSLD
jgi:hypothetical protein